MLVFFLFCLFVCLLNIALVFRKTILRNIYVIIDHGSAPIMISFVDGWSDQGSY
jgi:hypothetical protein